MSFEAVIGLEVHVQLKTESKMFCGCVTRFGAAPNTNVCPVCLGYPGAMPVMNSKAIRYTVMAGLMVGSEIGKCSKFDRKNYFYPDMPKNYQISQYDMPLCIGGGVSIETGTGLKTIRIGRIHLEEDTGKNMHFAEASGVDFNRAGVPLMEVVTEPDMTSPEEAVAFLHALKQIVVYAGISECNLEQGNMRCDVNCSVRATGRRELGVKTEIKNLNTFRGVRDALVCEIGRQIEILSEGGSVAQETRRWDTDAGVTTSMRSKEEAHDYRYFPEPDLMPIVLADETVEEWRRSLPELPQHRQCRFVSEYGLPGYDAGVLVAEKAVADFFERAAEKTSSYKALSNWIMTEVLRHLSESGKTIGESALTPEGLAGLIALVEAGEIGTTIAKEVIADMLLNGGDPAQIVRARGLSQVSDTDLLSAFVDEVVAGYPKSVEDYRKGKQAAIQFLVGQVMRLSRGKAEPLSVRNMLETRLKEEE